MNKKYQVSHSGNKSKEFPEGKESYCPECYFDNDKVILRKECKHQQDDE